MFVRSAQSSRSETEARNKPVGPVDPAKITNADICRLLCTCLILGQLLDQPFPVSQLRNRADTEDVREGASCGGGKQATTRVKLRAMRRRLTPGPLTALPTIRTRFPEAADSKQTST